jgi:4-amino-4-deoxy-L-arabinose transferase-like glycosyltransferase
VAIAGDQDMLADKEKAEINRQWPQLVAVAVFVIIVVVVNPLRELLTQDDGWAYARSVKHLLETGEYRLDSWAAANMPVQIYLATGLARIFGYSLSLLRICTLLLLLCGSLAFYRLLYESGEDSELAAALSICLICSPLILILGFTFMTDVQFLGWLLISCWLYARGLRRRSLALLFLGGLAAGLAIGTRQFGVALPAGVIFSWTAAERTKRPPAVGIVAGVAVPCSAFLWQLWAASSHPTFTQSVRLVEQIRFMHPLTMSLLSDLFWRTTVFIEYTALYLAALVPGVLLVLQFRRSQSIRVSDALPSRPVVSMTSLFICIAYLLAGHLLELTQATGMVLSRLKASLIPSIPWVIGFVMPNRLRYRILLTTLGVSSGAVLAGLLMNGANLKKIWCRYDPTGLFFGGSAVIFAVLHLFYVQLNDTYLIVFLPFVLIAISHSLRKRTAWMSHIWLITLVPVALGIAVAFWMRADYNKQEAIWQASEQIRSTGIDPMQIRGSLHWVEYHSAFDRWLADLGPTARPEDYAGAYRLHNPFYRWVLDKQRSAEFIVLQSDQFPQIEGYAVVGRVPYQDLLFRRRFVYILRR